MPAGRDTKIAKVCSSVSANYGAAAALVITGNAGIGKTLVHRLVLRLVGHSLTVPSSQQILSGIAPLVSGMNDAQRLDRPQVRLLEFCFRRLQREPVSIVLTSRRDDAAFPHGLERALPLDRIARGPLGTLSLGAIGELLRSRLGTLLPRYALIRQYEAAGQVPFYAIDCARLLIEHRRLLRTKEPILISDSLKELARHRLRRLPKHQRVSYGSTKCITEHRLSAQGQLGWASAR